MSADHEGGDCFLVAAEITLEPDKAGYEWVSHVATGHKRLLVHAEVTGRGPIAGERYTHAWVEIDENIVIDMSNGNNVICFADDYMRNAEVNPDKILRYTPEEAQRNMLDHEHYGPWHCEKEKVWDKSKKQ